jgi:hypothetical protein
MTTSCCCAPRGGEIPIHPIVLRRPFTALPAVQQYKVVLDHDGLRVFVVMADGAQSEETTRQVRAALAAGLEDTGVVRAHNRGRGRRCPTS